MNPHEDCTRCKGTCWVCEEHPDQPWQDADGNDHCGGAGMPCPEPVVG